jgi:hypothetical protein
MQSPAEQRRESFKAAAPYIRHQMESWVRHVDAFGYTRKQGDKMPRANEWRPYRFAVQDVIFALTSIRHAKAHNCIEVDVFLAFDPKYRTPEDDPPGEIPNGQDIYPYEPLAAAKALTLMLLSEAFRCGCPLKLKFTNNVERTEDERQAQTGRNENHGRVPYAILLLAHMYGIEGVDAESGVLDAAQGGVLFRRLTGFPPELDRRIEELAKQRLLTIERACYLTSCSMVRCNQSSGTSITTSRFTPARPFLAGCLTGPLQRATRKLTQLPLARRPPLASGLERMSKTTTGSWSSPTTPT